jgi:hypothetical protein
VRLHIFDKEYLERKDPVPEDGETLLDDDNDEIPEKE